MIDKLLDPAVLAPLALLLFASGRRWASGAVLVALIMLAMAGAGRLLVDGLQHDNFAGSSPEAIVVLPGDALALLDPAAAPPDIDTLPRLRVAAGLARRSGLPILVSGAGVWTGGPEIAAGMAMSLRTDFGVAVRWEEGVSTNLWQGTAAVSTLLRRAGISRVYVVAEPWDMRLAEALFRRVGVGIVAVPVLHPALVLDASALIVTTPGWVDSAVAIGQWAGLACDAVDACAARMLRADPS